MAKACSGDLISIQEINDESQHNFGIVLEDVKTHQFYISAFDLHLIKRMVECSSGLRILLPFCHHPTIV